MNALQKTELIVGVMGGLGPDASIDFMKKLVAGTAANCDQGHIHVLLDHNPKVPSRQAALAGMAPSVGPDIARMAARLESAGAHFLVMVCNTAHAYVDEIRAAINIPFISIIDVVIDELSNSDIDHVGVMATDACLRAELYQKALVDCGIEPILWSPAELEQFMQLVYRIKAGESDEEIGAEMEKLAASLAFAGAELLISGCTEAPLFLTAKNSPLPLLSSTDLLVRRTIDLAKRTRTLEI